MNKPAKKEFITIFLYLPPSYRHDRPNAIIQFILFIFVLQLIIKTKKITFMYLLTAQLGQIATNTANESGLMIVGLIACIATFALLLWKRDTNRDSNSHA